MIRFQRMASMKKSESIRVFSLPFLKNQTLAKALEDAWQGLSSSIDLEFKAAQLPYAIPDDIVLLDPISHSIHTDAEGQTIITVCAILHKS